jgi:hypothetical protein
MIFPAEVVSIEKSFLHQITTHCKINFVVSKLLTEVSKSRYRSTDTSREAGSSVVPSPGGRASIAGTCAGAACAVASLGQLSE